MQSVLTPYQNRTFSGYLTSKKSDKNTRSYQAFGVQLTGRNFVKSGSKESRYGFNGMEEDDELKGDGNSYDFGARIYDSRLGRWFAMDNTVKQDLSPYQSFRNNPVVFTDPDGNDEWNTIIIRGQNGKVVKKLSAKISNKYKAGGVYTFSIANGGDDGTNYIRYANGYDFRHVREYKMQEDGSLILIKSETQLLLKHGIKDREYGAFAQSGKEYACGLNGGYEQPGGLYMTGSGGQGTKYYSRNDVQHMDSDDLLGALSVLGKSSFKDLPTGRDVIPDLLGDIKDLADETGVPKGKTDPSVQSNQQKDDKKNNAVFDTLFTNDGGFERYKKGQSSPVMNTPKNIENKKKYYDLDKWKSIKVAKF